MSNGEAKNQQHRIIFADRHSLTPNENDLEIKRQWIEIYNENRNEGAVRSDGTIAWDCPCLGTQAIGPCSVPFRAAFSCYQNSNRERKGALDRRPLGSDCVAEWRKMQECFAKYPKLYGKKEHAAPTNQSTAKLSGHPEARRQRLRENREANI